MRHEVFDGNTSRWLSADEVDTVGGLLAKHVGRLPVVGSTTEVDGLHLTAERTEGRRKRPTEGSEPPPPSKKRMQLAFSDEEQPPPPSTTYKQHSTADEVRWRLCRCGSRQFST